MSSEHQGVHGVFVTTIERIERLGCCARITFAQGDDPAVTLIVPLYATFDIGKALQSIKDPPCLASNRLLLAN
jgi:hypothetical protein